MVPRLDLRQKQRLGLTPDMRLGLAILAMPAESLAENIWREAGDNPCLIIEETSGSASAYDAAVAITPDEETLAQTLARQVGLQRLAPDVTEAALVIVSELREDGYLDATLEELAQDYALALPALTAGLAAVQKCEPTGVGARNLAECLELQLREMGLAQDLARTVIARLGDFAEGRWARLAQALSIHENAVRRIGEMVRNLKPRPVVQSGTRTTPRICEILVEEAGDGTLQVLLNPDALPRVTAASGSGPLAPLAGRARTLVAAIAARQATLLRIARALVARQSAFFGPEARLDPLSRADLAAELGLHPSTVGRAIGAKSLTHRGRIHPFSLFFPSAVSGLDGAVSSFDTQRRIRALIQAEDMDHPLADEDIRSHLMEDGVDIARRTVAKYRKCLRIPSSFERRRRKVSRNGSLQSGPAPKPI